MVKRDANTFSPRRAIISLIARRCKSAIEDRGVTRKIGGLKVGFISEFRECRAGCDNKSLVSTEAGRFGNTKEDRQQRTWDGKSIARRFPGVPSSPRPYLPTFRINITLDSRHFFHHPYKVEINYASRCFFPSQPRYTTGGHRRIHTSFLFLPPRRPFYSPSI